MLWTKSPGTGGAIGSQEDFVVEELPSKKYFIKFTHSGGVKNIGGPYTLALLTKKGMTTKDALKFLQKELATIGRMQGSRLCLKGKLNSSIVNEKIEKYAREFVICNVCGKPDTEVVSEKGIKYKHCLACGAKSPVKYHM